jgi:superfamily II DNA or RNA helicase
VLVLTKEIEHSKILATMIGADAVQVDASDPAGVTFALRALAGGAIRAVVGTSVIGEGVDVPDADALVYAAGGQSRVKVVQDYFRVLTGSAGKTCGLIVDAADNHHDKLVENAARRLAIYRQSFGCTVMKPNELETWVTSAVS